jgi:RNA ligase
MTREELIDQGYISVQKHPNADLLIYNYTPKAQYDRVWNQHTLTCRGLITDLSGNIKARPFQKFFNLEEHLPETIPAESFEVYEKMDGSLGILYWIGDNPHIATRGSFVSDQSKIGTKILRSKYSHLFNKLDKSKTYLFEIIYPENRIVVDYKDMEDLVLLSVIDTGSGVDLPIDNIGFTVVKKHDGINDILILKTLEEENREGFVLKFKSGLRVKVKFSEYVRLHRIITNASSKVIWEYLKDKKDIEELLDKVPDEFYSWVKETRNKLCEEYNSIEMYCSENFKTLNDRKETAIYFSTLKYPSIMFRMLDNGEYESIIWKLIKPKFEKPFKVEI